jgi:hypothetical protein
MQVTELCLFGRMAETGMEAGIYQCLLPVGNQGLIR